MKHYFLTGVATSLVADFIFEVFCIAAYALMR